jgi:hypothetical protein
LQQSSNIKTKRRKKRTICQFCIAFLHHHHHHHHIMLSGYSSNEIVVVQYPRCAGRRHGKTTKNISRHGRPTHLGQLSQQQQRSVRFAEGDPVIHTTTMGAGMEERPSKDTTWYTAKDYQTMRKREARLTKEVSEAFKGEEFRVDGVESLTYRKARQARQRKAILTVLFDQEEHWMRIEELNASKEDVPADVHEKEIQKVHNDQAKAIARSYTQCARLSRRVAFETGYRLAKDLEGFNNQGAVTTNQGNVHDSNRSVLSTRSDDSSSTIDSSEDYQRCRGLLSQVE